MTQLLFSRAGRFALGAASFALILFLVLIQVDQFRDDRQLRDRVEESHAAQAQLYQLLSVHQDIETGQRGYVLTGNRDFLQPYDDGRARTATTFEALKRMAPASPQIARELPGLAELTREKLAFSRQVVQLRMNGRGAEAVALISAGEGKRVMDRIRDRVRRLVSSERQQLASLSAEAAASRQRVQLISGAIQLLLLALLASAYVAYLANVRRLTEATAEAADQSARQAAIFDDALDAMLVLDEDGCIEDLNPAAERLLGMSEGEARGLPITRLLAIPARDRTVRALLHRLAKPEREARREVQQFMGRRADGSTFDADVAISPVQLADGLKFLLAVRDATERRRTERMKTEFVSTVSHELRTPLTSIAGSLGLIAGGAVGAIDPRAAKLIGIAHTNSQRLVRLINDILDIEKIESGKMVFEQRPLNLRELVQNSIQSNLGFALGAGVEVALEHGGADAIVTADHDRLVQVFTNLLSNAIKFSPAGAAVRVRITPGTAMHRVTVSDCGPGIPEEFHERIFTKFAQADSSDTRSKGGTGLGLAIVKEIVDRSGGAIAFQTSAKGTSFHVDLPAARDDRSRARCVLLLQVDERLSAAIAASLEKQGIEVAVVRGIDELSEASAARSYGAILLGLQLGGDDAARLVRLIRTHPNLAGVPILASAAGDEEGQVSQALAVVDWLNKAPSAAEIRRGAELVTGADGEARELHVLHVEDDDDVIRVVEAAFGDRARITAARDAVEARTALASEAADLVILDLALPGESGLELLPDLRRPDGSPIPVVIYTASDEDPETAARVAAMLTKSKVELEDLVGTVLRVVKEERQA
ncbi:MAG TPA: CHASE3 domain-containing protein [Sphingomicrobium sp.]|jgi:PAS domain S-box-containing protein